MQGGGNDLDNGMSIPDIVDSCRSLFDTLAKFTDKPIIFGEILPRKSEKYMESLPQLNAALNELCTSRNVVVSKADSVFYNKNGHICDLAFDDGIHATPNATDYLIKSWGLSSLLRFDEKIQYNGHVREHVRLDNTVKMKTRWKKNPKEIAKTIPACIRADIIQCEPRANNVWLITSRTSEGYEYLLENGLIIDGQKMKCYDIDATVMRATPVSVTGVPWQLPDGEVDGFRRSVIPGTQMFTGEVIIDIEIQASIPPTVQIAKNITFHVAYKGQRPSCTYCGEFGHFASKCTKKTCYICRSPGHKPKDWPKAEACYSCGKKGHLMSSCHKAKEESRQALLEIAKQVKIDQLIESTRRESEQSDHNSDGTTELAGTSGEQSAKTSSDTTVSGDEQAVSSEVNINEEMNSNSKTDTDDKVAADDITEAYTKNRSTKVLKITSDNSASKRPLVASPLEKNQGKKQSTIAFKKNQCISYLFCIYVYYVMFYDCSVYISSRLYAPLP